MGFRLLIISLLVLSLAGIQLVRAADDLSVVFALDASDSVGLEARERAESAVRQAVEGMSPSDQAAVVVFGAQALVDRPMSGLAELAPITSAPITLGSDLAEAIRLGLALFPAGNARRLVLISDGAATLGDTLGAARLAAASGVPIDVVTLSRPPAPAEALLRSVDAPARVSQGERFNLEVAVESTQTMAASFRILSRGIIVDEFDHRLNPGLNTISRTLRASDQAFARYVIQMTPARDTVFQNNELAAFTEITGPPRVLLVAPDGTLDDRGLPSPAEAPQLLIALRATGLEVDRVTPAELPSSLARLSQYASVVMTNVNAKSLSPRKMAALQSYVRDLGGGLVVVGGPQSYGVGGYFRTALEETLPVDMQIKDEERFPSVSMAIVIDRSGSMSVREGNVTKIQLAAEGAVRVVELLNEFDEITILPVDTRSDNPIGPAPAGDRETIISQIRQIGAGGGGIFVRTGLEAAADALAQSNNQIKHIIVLADGADSEQKEGVEELISALAGQGVTVSMVAIGQGPDVPWLRQMAELGSGRFHFTDQAANLPQIFTQETTAIQRTYLVEERFFPSLASGGFARGHAIFRAMESAGLTRVPPLLGYVGTSPKQTAQVILESHLADPLLAAWEYGLGRSAAWTSDATGRWAVDWVRWDGFPAFWSNVVRWTISRSQDGGVETAIELVGEEARLSVDVQGGDGSYLNNLSLAANVVDPDGRATELSLQQVAPGRYRADFTPPGPGAYFIGVGGGDETDQIEVGQTGGWVLAYSPEYSRLEADPGLMSAIAALTGGRDLTDAVAAGDVGPIFQHDLPGGRASRPIWPWLLGLAAALLPLDIAIRRLVITRGDLERAWSASFGRLSRTARPAPEPSQKMARLFQAKDRAAAKRGETGTHPQPASGLADHGMRDERDHGIAGTPEDQLPERREHEAPGSTSAGDQTLAARLLERRRRRDQDDE